MDTPLTMSVTKAQPKHWIRSGVTALVILAGDGGLTLHTSGKLDDSGAWQAKAAARNALVISKLDSLLCDNRDTIYAYIHDTIYLKISK